jgi:HlyD family secretion protein
MTTELTTAPGSPPATLQERVESLRLNKEIRVPPRRGGKLFWIIILAIFAGTGYWAYKNYGDQIRNALSSSTAPMATSTAPAISVAEKEKVPTNIVQEAGGYVVPKQRVQVSPKVGGLVKELFIEEGKFVEAGQPIAKLEVEEYLFEYRRAAALAELARAKYDEALKGNRDEEKLQAAAAEKEAEESLRQAREELSKLKASGQATTRDELDKADSRVRIAEQKLFQQRAMNELMKKGTREERQAAAKAEHEQACADRDKAKWRLDACTVVAPISGVILEKKTELGNTVRPEAFSNGLSASVCDMADLKNLEVEVDISERDIRKIKKNQKCIIRTEAFTDKKYEGQVARIMPVASRSKASVTVRVKIMVPDDERDLRPEMRARVQFLKDEEDKSSVTAGVGK